MKILVKMAVVLAVTLAATVGAIKFVDYRDSREY